MHERLAGLRKDTLTTQKVRSTHQKISSLSSQVFTCEKKLIEKDFRSKARMVRGNLLDVTNSTLNQSREKKQPSTLIPKEPEGLSVFKESLARIKAEARSSQLVSSKYKRS